MNPPTRRSLRLAALLLAVSAVGAGQGPGARVADKHVAFARELAAKHLRLSTDLAQVAEKVEDDFCRLSDRAATRMKPDEAEVARRYATEYCQPWQKFWDKALGPCDGDRPPDWCDDETSLPAHVDLQGYFATLSSGIEAAASPLERDNIMDMVTSTLGAHVLTEFPRDMRDTWATVAVIAYLKEASPDQALALAKALKDTWVGLVPPLVHAFDDYLDGPTVFTAEQRETMHHVLAGEVVQ